MPEPPVRLVRACTQVDQIAQRLHTALVNNDVVQLERALADTARLTDLSTGLHQSLREYIDDCHFFR